MNQKIIRKCLAELESDNPDLSYVRGMLEVLATEEELMPFPLAGINGEVINNTRRQFPTANVAPAAMPDEGSMLDRMAAAQMGQVKILAEASVD